MNLDDSERAASYWHVVHCALLFIMSFKINCPLRVAYLSICQPYFIVSIKC